MIGIGQSNSKTWVYKSGVIIYQTTNNLTPFPNDIYDSSKLTEIADNFKFDENGRKLSISVENTGKRRNCS